MKTKILWSVVCLGAAVMPALIAQSGKSRVTEGRLFGSAGASYLGIGVADIDAERAKALNLKEERGVEIKNVVPDSPAAKAGLKEGDVVLEYNGEKVEGTEQFMRMVRETPSGRQVPLVIWRNGATQKVTAVIGTRSRAMRMPGDGFSIQIPPIPVPPFPPNMGRSTMLGVDAESLTPQLAEYFGVKDGGVLVRSVIKDSAAEKAGIKAGDVIIKVDNDRVSSPRQITSALRGLRLPKTIPVVVVRKQQEMTIQVTLEAAHPEDMGWPDRAGLPEDEA